MRSLASWLLSRSRWRTPMSRFSRSPRTIRTISSSKNLSSTLPSTRLPAMVTPSVSELPKLYGELSSWFHLLSAPADYAEEAEFVRSFLVDASATGPVTLLELGSGGGNNASHLKAHFKMTLVDLSSGMLDLSRKLNPECEHLQGDMKTLRLERTFDAVFIHDAIMYMTND